MGKILVFIVITFGMLSHSFADEITKNYDKTYIEKANVLSDVAWIKQRPKKPKPK
ncbi:hypothetical protein OQH61_07835 [Helicobacter sp. MIT 21-1697]|uniref:hypothetical protein n=1 Tax=Helicobacter sp. MIT 21-1697 TaxID=2993733 RepID=UPI00224A78A7|nr:hypothetical protein [Helicobacter sp. MIT 21-1697]MCX2717642.1 hypothetical protein [Helicobacter sp. MIT 21-1697]